MVRGQQGGPRRLERRELRTAEMPVPRPAGGGGSGVEGPRPVTAGLARAATLVSRQRRRRGARPTGVRVWVARSVSLSGSDRSCVPLKTPDCPLVYPNVSTSLPIRSAVHRGFADARPVRPDENAVVWAQRLAIEG